LLWHGSCRRTDENLTPYSIGPDAAMRGFDRFLLPKSIHLHIEAFRFLEPLLGHRTGLSRNRVFIGAWYLASQSKARQLGQ
jgi:hypothetical protein